MIKSYFWPTILDDVVFFMNEIIAGSILSTTDALYCIHDNTWCDCIRCFDQDVVLSTGNANTVEKQAKYEQEE